MNINRHNYEEYFILYMDNELNSDERRQVDEFIEKNPDLKEELDILFQYKLVPDADIIFSGKEELLKHDGLVHENFAGIPGNGYQEWLMLYIDNELNADERIAVEKFIQDNPAIKEELIILQRTKLQPEQIHFAYKESLYKKEEVAGGYRRILIAMNWWRVAAAVILLLVLGFTVAVLVNKKSVTDKNQMVKVPVNIPVQRPEEKKETVKEENEKIATPPVSNAAQNELATTTTPSRSKKGARLKTIDNNIKKNKQEKLIINNNDQQEPILVENKPKQSNNLPQPENSTDQTTVDVVNAKGIKQHEETIPQELVAKNPVTPDAIQTSNNESGGKKSKLRGFFRKLTRTFEKTTNIDATDEDRVLIGGLAFKLK